MILGERKPVFCGFDRGESSFIQKLHIFIDGTLKLSFTNKISYNNTLSKQGTTKALADQTMRMHKLVIAFVVELEKETNIFSHVDAHTYLNEYACNCMFKIVKSDENYIQKNNNKICAYDDNLCEIT